MEDEIKSFLIEELALEDITAADIDAAAPLFGEGLGLDSIDALELGVALHRRYGVKVEAASPDTRKHFASVHSLARFVQENRTK